MNCMTVLRCPVQIYCNSNPASVRLNLLGLLIRWPIKFEIFRKGVVKLMTLAFHLRYSASPGCTMNEVSPTYWKEYFLIICWKDFLLQRKNKSSLNNNWLSVIFCLSFYTLHSTLGLNSGTQLWDSDSSVVQDLVTLYGTVYINWSTEWIWSDSDRENCVLLSQSCEDSEQFAFVGATWLW